MAGQHGGLIIRRIPKKLLYETHAVMRMRQRSISEDQVEEAILSPDHTRKARRRGARRVEKRISTRRRLAVIIEEAPDFIRILTAFWVR